MCEAQVLACHHLIASQLLLVTVALLLLQQFYDLPEPHPSLELYVLLLLLLLLLLTLCLLLCHLLLHKSCDVGLEVFDRD